MLKTKSARIFAVLLFPLICGPHAYGGGPNASAGCALDLDIQTRNYTNYVSEVDIESKATVEEGEDVFLNVVVSNVTDLDTYKMELNFDDQILTFVDGWSDIPAEGIVNILETQGGLALCMAPMVTSPGTITVACGLTSKDTNEAPEGSGVAAIIQFNLLTGGPCTKIELSGVEYIASDGMPDVVDHINILGHAYVNFGHVRAVEQIGDCPAEEECYVGIANAMSTMGECGELYVHTGTYNETMEIEKDILVIVQDPEVVLN